MKQATVRTVLRMRARAGCETEFETAWLAAAAEISRVPGNVRQELARDVSDPRTFSITSDWTDRAAVDAFGRSPARDAITSALRELREDASRNTYELLVTIPAEQPRPVRIDLSTSVGPGEEEAFERAYEIVTGRLKGTPGLVREELLRESGSNRYHIFAEWATEQDFINWVDDPSHADQSGPLARWLSVDFSRRVFEIRYRPAEQSQAPGAEALLAAPERTRAVPETTLPVQPAPPSRAQPAAVEPPPPASPARGTPRGQVEVLIVGAGPAGLTHAVELARRGIAVRLIDKRPEAASQADKAIGIHCRTMEIWETQGIVDEAMNAGIWLHGQTVFVNGQQTHQVDWAGLSELPYAHLGLPQYETERILTDKLASLGVRVERGVELLSFVQDDDRVAAQVRTADGATESVPSQYLVGCDGAHSVVRGALGLTFEGGLSMFPQLFMLGDVDLDWDMPEGHLLRFVRIEDDGDFTGMLVCVPLKGRGRYRVATLAPQKLQKTIGSGVVPAGFWAEYTPPGLADIQAVLDDLGPAGTTASNLRWSSIFRIKHGIVDRYREGRVFVAGDAAHLHPPAGGQGMNTGIQDAWNLGWKLALAVRGLAAPGLLDSYEAERRPAGKAIVDRAVAIAFTDEMDMEDEKAQFLLEMQMTMNYAGSAIVGEHRDENAGLNGPQPGYRAPDVHGLSRFGVGHPLRLFDLLRGTHVTLLLHADNTLAESELLDLEKLAVTLHQQAHGQLRSYLIADAAVRVPKLLDLPVLRDSRGEFREVYQVNGSSAYLIRPDGHVGYRCAPAALSALQDHLQLIFADD